MNISTPIGTEITEVNFGFYTAEDVERFSVRQIVNPNVFDNLGHPTSGGLYDLALGPFLGKSSCATCHLDERYCPGHFGHILLPQPVYHPLLFKSMMTLLKATCLYCHRFRLTAVEVHRYASKLKLLSRGLVFEAQLIDELSNDPSAILQGMDIDMKDDDNSASEDGDGDNAVAQRLIQKREKFIRRALRHAQTGNYVKGKTTTAAEERKDVVRDCLKSLGRSKRCPHCAAISPHFKQEENSKVFEMSLNPQDAKYMAGRGMTRVDVNFDSVKKPAVNGVSRDVVIEDDEDTEEESEGADVMSDHNLDPTTKKGPRKASKKSQEYILSTAVRNHLRRLFENESAILALLFNVNGSGKILTADHFFLTVIAVPPTRYRPAAKEGDTIRESPQNTQLTRILNTCQRIAQLNVQREDETAQKSTDKYRYLHQQIDAFVQLQLDVNSLLDSTASISPVDKLSGRVPPPGIKQTLEKKEGLFRKHMMGKRVNYAARSVISPDPNIDTNEIGIPPFIAQKLTFPEPVTPWNVAKLRRAVINGPRVYPGASYVEQEDGKTQSLEPLSLEQRTALAHSLLTSSANQTGLTHGTGPTPTYLNKKVHRHLETGDILLVNRQPTLHKPSIMGHKAKVLTLEKTIRLHYANCNTYNADFDGDEMNVHFPQNSLARAEAYNIANTDNQYLGPTNGNPLRGLIQDHISVAVWMTKRDTFFTRSEYQQLLYGSILPEEGGCGGHDGRIVMLPPAIRKPRVLWTGKQVVSSILLNLTPRDRPGLYLDGKSQVKAANWGTPNKEEGSEWLNSEEQTVLFDNGELLCGILDKAQIGPSAYGFVHSVYEIYGADVAGKLLSAMGRLFTKYSQMLSISCGMEDIRISAAGRETRKRVLEEKADIGKEAAVEYVGLKDSFDEQLFLERMEEVTRDPEKLSGLDRAMQRATSGLTTVMYKELVPVHLIKKFPYNNMQLMTESKAKGASDNANLISSIIGQQSLEGGRVPIMISGKTLPSFQPFDPDIRAGGYVTSCYLTGIQPHEYFFYCMAGREGLIDTAVKTSRSGYLQRCLVKHLEGMSVQYDNTVRDSDGSLIQFLYGEDGLDVAKQKHLLDFDFSAKNWRSLISKYEPKNAPEWLADKTAARYAKKALKKTHKYDPVLSKYSPSRNLGSTSENFHVKLDEFIETGTKDGGVLTKESEDLTAKKFRALMEFKYLRSLIDPGEAVGVLAAQSIGEPSTQMTLNTFHLAGFGAGNVTLGVPRLREIIMTASRSIKTPNITLAMRPKVTEEETDKLAKRLSRVILAQVVDEIVVTERFGKDDDGVGSTKVYVARLRFFPRKEYEEEYLVTAEQVQKVLATKFMKLLAMRVRNTVKKTGGRKRKVGEVEAAPAIGQGKKRTNGAETDDDRIPRGGEESDDDDNDYDHQKRARQAKEQGEYDGPDDEDRAIIRREDREEDDDDESTQDETSLKKNPQKDKFVDKFAIKTIEEVDLHDMQELNQNLRNFTFDTAKGGWCEMEFEYPLKMGKILMENVVEKVCQLCVIREIEGITQCIKMPPTADKSGPTVLVAEGRNLTGLWDLGDLVDLNVLSSNDIGAILDTYGVEAGRACIIKEINSIFGMYSITVDMRHLTLIADYMTFGGGYKPFNRLGLDTNVSPFLKMSFEQTCAFLTKATIEGDSDRLETPSARLVMGRSIQGGTGSFDVLTRI